LLVNFHRDAEKRGAKLFVHQSGRDSARFMPVQNILKKVKKRLVSLGKLN
jgi:hypothetical protein